MKKSILFVDDERCILAALRRMLRDRESEWDMTFVDRAEAAWEHLSEADFDAVVTDVKMPGIGGLKLLQRIRETDRMRDLPVIILTGLLDRGLKAKALDLGATDLLNKPVEAEELLARLLNVLKLKSYQDQLKRQNEILEQKVIERTGQLAASRLDIIWRLGKVAEFRDEETGNHVVRVGFTSRIIAETMGMGHDFVENLFLAAPLHDIGKIGIPDAILLKPGKLTDGERNIMERHCVIGAAILRQDSRMTKVFQDWLAAHSSDVCHGCASPLMEIAATIALTHHEKWDGSGYPRGLVGENIPRESRIVALSDVYDALRSERPYKPEFSEDKAMSIIREGAGRHFDPAVVVAFEASHQHVNMVREEFADHPDAQRSWESIHRDVLESSTSGTGQLAAVGSGHSEQETGKR